MFCSKCGTQVNPSLTYCNSCGGRLKGEKPQIRTAAAGAGLVTGMIVLLLVGLGGLGMLLGLVAILLKQGVDTGTVAFIATAFLATVFCICFMLMRQVSKLVDATVTSEKGEPLTNVPDYLPAASAPRLDAFREPVRSVTENTTNILEETPVKQGKATNEF